MSVNYPLIFDIADRIMPRTNVIQANAIRDYIIARMHDEFPTWEYDQWLAMDVVDLNKTREYNYHHYIYEFKIEFDIDD